MRIYFAIQLIYHRFENSINARAHLMKVDVDLKKKNQESSSLRAESELSKTEASGKETVLSQLTEKSKAEALRKYQLIRPFLQKEKSLITISKESQLSLRTAKDWVKRYRQHGLGGLARKSRRDSGVRRSCSQKTQQLIEGLHLQKSHLSGASIYREIRKYAKIHPLKYPSYRTICNIISQLPHDLTTLAHQGSKQYKEQFDLLYIREANTSNELWQADHMLLDILLIHEGEKTGVRPWLTVIEDDYSRAVAGYELSFMSPSAIKTALCLRQAIWRKKESTWSVCGIPSMLYTDHGSDFTSKHIEQVCIDLKIQLIFSQVGVPRGRGKIERFFRTLNQMLLSELEGYTESKNPIPTFTLAELDNLIRAFIIDYNQRQHQSTKEPPKHKWEKSGFLPHLPSSLEHLDLLLLTLAKPRKIKRDGIHFQGLRYLDSVLADYVGESVIIRYDPSDLTSIRVFYKNKYLCQPICHDLDLQAVSLKEIQAARNTRRKNLQLEINQRISLVDAILGSKKRQSSSEKLPLKISEKPKLKLYSSDE